MKSIYLLIIEPWKPSFVLSIGFSQTTSSLSPLPVGMHFSRDIVFYTNYGFPAPRIIFFTNHEFPIKHALFTTSHSIRSIAFQLYYCS